MQGDAGSDLSPTEPEMPIGGLMLGSWVDKE